MMSFFKPLLALALLAEPATAIWSPVEPSRHQKFCENRDNSNPNSISARMFDSICKKYNYLSGFQRLYSAEPAKRSNNKYPSKPKIPEPKPASNPLWGLGLKFPSLTRWRSDAEEQRKKEEKERKEKEEKERKEREEAAKANRFCGPFGQAVICSLLVIIATKVIKGSGKKESAPKGKGTFKDGEWVVLAE